jgi:hypothetical protein
VDHPAVEVEGGHAGHPKLAVAQGPDEPAHGLGDLAGVEQGGGNLVEQRSEEVVIVAVDEGHLDRQPTQPPGQRESGEPRPHDHHPRPVQLTPPWAASA